MLKAYNTMNSYQFRQYWRGGGLRKVIYNIICGITSIIILYPGKQCQNIVFELCRKVDSPNAKICITRYHISFLQQDCCL